MAALGGGVAMRKKVLNPKLKSLVFVVVTLFFVTVTYTNCSKRDGSSSDPLNQSGGSIFHVPQEHSYAGNGGGYNGPHLSFELIPAIDESETAGLSIFNKNLETAWKTCQMGDLKKGALGVYPKIQMQITGIAATKFCNKLDANTTELAFGALGDTKYQDAVQADPNFSMTYEFFKTLGEIDTLITDVNLKQTAFQCVKAVIESAGRYPGEGSFQISLQSMALSSFDPELDPPEEADQLGTSYNLKIKVNRSEDNSTTFRFVTQNGLPAVLRTDQVYYGNSNTPVLDPKKEIARIIPVLPTDFGIKTPLYDTVSKQFTGLTFNQFEYMSCIQGEIYRDPKAAETIESSLMAKTRIIGRTTSAKFCDALEPWKQAIAARASLESWSPLGDQLRKVSESWEQEYSVRTEVARNIFKAYLKGEMDLSGASACLEDTGEALDFMNSLRSVFYQESVGTLAKSQNPRVFRYLSLLSLFDSQGAWSLFDLRGVGRLTPSEAVAGEHRRHQNIFMDFSKIQPTSWWIIFLHETLHRLDNNLYRASYFFSTSENQNRVRQLASQFKSVSQLSEGDAQFLEEWVGWGFERGIVSEYRAWLQTFQIYQQLTSEKVIPRLEWLDNYLAGRDASAIGFQCELFNDLNKNSLGKFSFDLLNRDLLKDAINLYAQKNFSCEAVVKIQSIVE